jgi:hypothetical protein
MEWDSLVEKAVRDAVAALHGPVTGSRLRVLVAKEAVARGMKFPPVPGQTFSAFLKQFESKIIIQRRPGQDFLVVPADNPALLAAPTTREPASRIRKDLYAALTRIPGPAEGMPYYIRSAGIVNWFTPDVVPPGDAVALPVATLEQEVEDRARFVRDTDLAEAVRSALTAALSSTAPLGYFTQTIRSYGLVQRWHVFKLDILIERLKTWADQNEIPWQDTWIERRSTTPRPVQVAGPASTAAELRSLMNQLAEVMYDTDLSRINLPLDLVLKAWSRRT